MGEIKKTLIEMLTKPVEDNFVGWLLIALLWLLFLMLAAIIIYGILAAFNYWFRPKQEGYGQIVATVFEPAHYSTYYNAATRTPMTTWHPNAWKIVIDVDGAQDDFYLDANKYVKYRAGQRVKIVYTTGRLWKSLSIKSAWI